jgi:amidophosphoribosyltransferase
MYRKSCQATSPDDIIDCLPINTYSVEALSLLQHRGQDAAGVVTCGSGGRFYQVKSNGMVRDVFDSKAVAGLKGWMGVGHGA